MPNLLNRRPAPIARQRAKNITAPADVTSGLAFEWNAADLGATLADGAKVSSWTDRIAGRALTQATSGQQPVYVATGVYGKPGVQFTAANLTTLNTTTVTSIPTTNVTIVIVAGVPYANSSAARAFCSFTPATGSTGGWGVQMSTSETFRFTTYGVKDYTTAARPMNVASGYNPQGINNPTTGEWAPAVMAATFDSSFNGKVSWNGHTVKTVTHTSGATGTLGKFAIGNRANVSDYSNATIAVVRLYNRVLSNAEILQVSRYLGASYGIRHIGQHVNASAALTVPASDANPAVGHPDVIKSVLGNNYVMVMSPYPAESRENPEVLVSSDGTTWTVPVGLTNPIDPYPGSGGTNPPYNSDPDLWFDGTTCYLVWREVTNSTTERIAYRTSTDLVTWSADTTILSKTTNGAELLSPSLDYKSGTYYLWTVRQVYASTTSSTNPIAATARVIELRTAATIAGLGSATPVVTDLQSKGREYTNWHMNVCQYSGSWWALVNDRYSLWVAKSTDGVTWTVPDWPALSPSTDGWDAAQLYRATMVPLTDNTGFDCWYTGIDNSNTNNWRIGRCSLLFSDTYSMPTP